MSTTLVVGLGCQRGCTANLLRELIEQNLQAHGVAIDAITALASIDHKSTEPGLLELAVQLNLPLVFLSAAELADVEALLSHRSALAFAHTGCHGVAESAALALAQRLAGRPVKLLINRQKNQYATFALAGDVPNRR
ncbi:cobalamin biosynthesis protein [Pseudomonas sp.]|uniref:cobalamin biosynthesis protein n=1 Tax=Pseudomonas sp. TaxID=306 RepID=UPI00260B18B4|nr:cobalamin biosynthesis protein [Pseudomonas sp.]